MFEAVHEVLKREEHDWARVLEHVGEAERAEVRERFEWTWGVRSASEVAVGYLATKLLVIERRLGAAFVWPERSCRGGRMDLWVGDDRAAAGLGVEFKFLMSNHEASTVPGQAQRLRRDQTVESAAFILWGHGVEEGTTLDPEKLFSEAEAGWSPWTAEVSKHFTAYYRGAKPMTVWLFSSDREVLAAKPEERQ